MEFTYEELFPEVYDDFFEDIMSHGHTHYKLNGGRGSIKSSFVSIVIPLLMMQHQNIHVIVMRKVANTIRTSVFSQIQWGIDKLGLSDVFTVKQNPPQIINKFTGQQILFFGLDNADKIKSIKLPFGYIGVVWFEEYDQFTNAAEIRKVLQSTMRGGDLFWNFYSFNPPISANNWANRDFLIKRDDTLCMSSTYLDVPREWLGEAFFDEAEALKKFNKRAYEHEYLGIPTGTGGNVFENVKIRKITDSEIYGELDEDGVARGGFDRIFMGMDFGWYPDPTAWVKMHFSPTNKTLYIYDEYVVNKMPTDLLWENLQAYKGVTKEDLITCDNDNAIISDLRSYGAFARSAIKGSGSISYGMKWLQALYNIVIDPKRCPVSAKEFLEYEYVRDKEGNPIQAYPDGNDHCISAVRYALERYYSRRGN